MVKVVITDPGNVVLDSFEALMPRPTVPPVAQPPNIGLVEIATSQPTDSADDILTKLLTVDGAGSGLDADLLDGQQGAYYLPAGSYTASDVLAKLLTVDGAGSGLDADLLDGQDGGYYLAWANLTGKPATFPPTLPIAQSDVTNLVSDLAAKAPLASPGLTGTPTAPTASAGTNSTQLATTAFVEVATAPAQLLADIKTVDGAGSGLDADLLDGNDSTFFATAAGLALKAPLASPVFTGDPQAPTPAAGDNDTSIATTKFVKDALTAGGAVPSAERFNRFINPAFQCSQETGNGSSGNLTGGTWYVADQWYVSWSLSPGACAAFRNSSPAGLAGVSQYCGYTVCNTAIATLPAGGVWYFRQVLEGIKMADLGWGNAWAKKIVIRFQFMASVAGVYSASLLNGATNRCYVHTFNVPTPSVWQKVEFQVPGDTTGTWDKANGIGVYFSVMLASGSTYITSTLDAWQAGVLLAGTGQVNLAATAGAFAQVAELGFYADPNNTGVAPPWETPDEATELAKSQRYWQKTGYNIWMGQTNNTSGYNLAYPLGVEMRAIPTCSGGVNAANSSFPAAVGTLAGIDTKTVREGRAASATAAVGSFGSNAIVASARL